MEGKREGEREEWEKESLRRLLDFLALGCRQVRDQDEARTGHYDPFNE